MQAFIYSVPLLCIKTSIFSNTSLTANQCIKTSTTNCISIKSRITQTDCDDVAMVTLDSMQRANSTLHDFAGEESQVLARYFEDVIYPTSHLKTKPFTSIPHSGSTVLPSTIHWSSSHSAAVYRINGWGAPYFYVNTSGNVNVRPHGSATKDHQEIDLLKVVKKASDLKASGGLELPLPLIIRFPDILKNRLESIHSAFNHAIESHSYGSSYRGVYPVKCNQDCSVVEDIVKFGSSLGFGLEAGSKPELLLAMSCLCKVKSDQSLLVCNGFKDAEYISLALIARKLSLNTVIVLEQEEELDYVIDISHKLGVLPLLGVRVKLQTKHSGHFGSTSGENGKFGLTTTQILRVVKKLGKYGMLDCLQLLHFHMGSQIPSVALLADGVREATHVYCELVRLGASMKVIDIGGGLGIDYDGSKSTNSDVSVGYTIEEYAEAVVHTVKRVCDRKSVKHPLICSESGRAIVSHHSVLIFDASSSRKNSTQTLSPSDVQQLGNSLPKEARSVYHNLSQCATRGDNKACLAYAHELKQRCVEAFKDGCLGIEQLADVDRLYDLVAKITGASDPVTTYHINLSVFTSIPDFWSIGQVFPIMPIHRLNECPNNKGVLSDLTCDSDGKINRFIGGESSLPLHELEGDQNGMKYYLGMFLGGAYEEALGGVHNLFGPPSVIRVSQSHEPCGFSVIEAMSGQSCGDVLSVMHYEPQIMFQTIKHRIQDYIDEGGMDGLLIAGGIAKSFRNMPYLSSSCFNFANEYSNTDDGEDNQGSFVCT